VEEKVVASTTQKVVCKFIWKNIITRFGVPKAIVFDNKQEFDTDNVQGYYADDGIQIRFMAIARPQTKGQTKSTNKHILNGLKKRLDDTKGYELMNSLQYSSLFRRLRRVLSRKYLYGCTWIRSHASSGGSHPYLPSGNHSRNG